MENNSNFPSKIAMVYYTFTKKPFKWPEVILEVHSLCCTNPQGLDVINRILVLSKFILLENFLLDKAKWQRHCIPLSLWQNKAKIDKQTNLFIYCEANQHSFQFYNSTFNGMYVTTDLWTCVRNVLQKEPKWFQL